MKCQLHATAWVDSIMLRYVDEERKWTSKAFEHQAVVGAVSGGGVPAADREDTSV